LVDLSRAPLGKPENGTFAESHLGENGRFAESQGKGLSAKEPRDGQIPSFAESPSGGSRQRLFSKKKLSLCLEPSWRLSAKTKFA